MKLAPIAFFCYNRPEHTRRTLEALSANPEAAQSELYIFADGPKPDATPEQIEKIMAVRKVLREKRWCKEIYFDEAATNRGINDNIAGNITRLFSMHEKAIFIEDDIVTSPGFLSYMNKALELYADNEQVMHIGGYIHPLRPHKLPAETFFLYLTTVWGWASWRRAWQHYSADTVALTAAIIKKGLDRFTFGGTFKFHKHLHVWDVQWYASCYIREGLSLLPRRSLVQNIGNDNSGTHTHRITIFDHAELAPQIEVRPIPVEFSTMAYRELQHFYRWKYGRFRITYFFKRLFSKKR
jgi:hypothetical protein